MNKPRISVVLPVFNGDDFIGEALASLLAQGEGVEIVVSDDCSTDRTVEIVRPFTRTGQVKLLLNERNGGQFVNFNRALRAATGEVIQFFSHDDLAGAGFLDDQLAALNRAPGVGLVYASCNVIDPNGALLIVLDDDGTPEIIDLPAYLSISSKHGSLPPSVSCVMIARQVLDKAGPFDERFEVAGDLEFYNRVAENYLLARNRHLRLDVRVHRGSVTARSNTPLKFIKEELLLLPFYERHLGPEGYAEMLKWRARHRGKDHARHLLHLALRLKLKSCWSGCSDLSKVHSIPECMFYAMKDHFSQMFALRHA
ncbi:MAG: glycosyltransferase [Rhodomicrobium sp.]